MNVRLWIHFSTFDPLILDSLTYAFLHFQRENQGNCLGSSSVAALVIVPALLLPCILEWVRVHWRTMYFSMFLSWNSSFLLGSKKRNIWDLVWKGFSMQIFEVSTCTCSFLSCRRHIKATFLVNSSTSRPETELHCTEHSSFPPFCEVSSTCFSCLKDYWSVRVNSDKTLLIIYMVSFFRILVGKCFISLYRILILLKY